MLKPRSSGNKSPLAYRTFDFHHIRHILGVVIIVVDPLMTYDAVLGIGSSFWSIRMPTYLMTHEVLLSLYHGKFLDRR